MDPVVMTVLVSWFLMGLLIACLTKGYLAVGRLWKRGRASDDFGFWIGLTIGVVAGVFCAVAALFFYLFTGGGEKVMAQFIFHAFLGVMAVSLSISLSVTVYLLKRCMMPLGLRFWVGFAIGILVGAIGLVASFLLAVIPH